MKKFYLIIILLFLTNQLFALAPKTEFQTDLPKIFSSENNKACVIQPIIPISELTKKQKKVFDSIMACSINQLIEQIDEFQKNNPDKFLPIPVEKLSHKLKRDRRFLYKKEHLSEFLINLEIDYNIKYGEYSDQDYLNYLCPTTTEKNKLEEIKVLCIWGSQDLDNIIYTINLWLTQMIKCDTILISGGIGAGTQELIKKVYEEFPTFFEEFNCTKINGKIITKATEAEIIYWLISQIIKTKSIFINPERYDLKFIIEKTSKHTGENAKNTYDLFKQYNLPMYPTQIALSQGPFVKRSLHTFEKYFKFQPLPICKQRKYTQNMFNDIVLEFWKLINFHKRDFMTEIDEQGYAMLGVYKSA